MSIPAPGAPRRLLRPALVANGFTLAFLLAWFAYAQVIPAYQLPGPWPVAKRIAAFLSDFEELTELGLSLMHVSIAIGISFICGCMLAALAHWVWPLRLFIDGRLTPFLNAFSGIGWLRKLSACLTRHM